MEAKRPKRPKNLARIYLEAAKLIEARKAYHSCSAIDACRGLSLSPERLLYTNIMLAPHIDGTLKLFRIIEKGRDRGRDFRMWLLAMMAAVAADAQNGAFDEAEET